MQRTLTALLVAAMTALGAQSAAAHHSFAAEFDANSPIELTGTVTKVEWANPHTFFYIDVTTPEGRNRELGARDGQPERLDAPRLDARLDEDRRRRDGDGLARQGRQHQGQCALGDAVDGQKLFAGSSEDNAETN